MANVISRSLPWLTKPSTGHDLFAKPSKTFVSYPSLSLVSTVGVVPRRAIATRDTEVFVGRGNEVRCADLQDLKARHPKFQVVVDEKRKLGYQAHKTLKLPHVLFEIHQLEISNDRLFLAIVGQKELAVCVLPGEGFLGRSEIEVTVPHFHKVGKGYHSADGPDIVRVLWHPLGVEGASLIVLTSDGFVRTYDFTIGNDLSFALPDQTLDLLTLGGKKRCTGGFTADEDEMEPASCCFGAGEQGWRPFTLYILMRGGDIYALSPIVPSRWMATGDYLRNLSMNTAAELEDLNSDASWLKRAAIRSQTKWVNHVLDQESKLANRYPILTSSPRQSNPTCLARPDVVESNPILQGPFLLQPEPERFPGDDTTHAACDIFHIEGGSVGLLGVVYSHGKVEICLECEPLTARWVDKKKGSSTPEEIPDLPVISCYEVVDLGFNVGSESAHTNWPVFSSDPHSEATWYVNHRGGVTSLSMQQWVSQLGTVLDDEEEDYKFISKILNKTPTMVQSIIVSETPSSTNAVVGSAAVYSAYIGYVFIAISCSDVFSVEFEWPSGVADTTSEDGKTTTLNTTGCEFRTLRADGQSTLNAVDSAPSLLSHSPAAHSMAEKLSVLQPPYSVSPEFSVLSSLPSLLQQVKMRYPQIMAGSIILSAESNTVLRAARDTLKSEFDQVMAAAQEMYDRAAAQRLEYEKQLETISTVNRRLANLKEKNVRERLDNYTVQQEKLQAKADELLRIMVIKNVKGLSDAEKKWSQEVARVHERLNGEGRTSLTRRKSEVKDMLIELCTETKDDDMRLSNEEQIDGVPTEVRRRKLRQLRQLLDREDALVNATRKKLEGLELDAERLL